MEKKKSSIVLKAGMWYTISSFLSRGMAFITTPIFSRMLSKTEYGSYSNFASWVSILLVLTSCEFYTSIIRSKLEFEDDIDSFVFSLQCLCTLLTGIAYLICCIFKEQILGDFMGIDPKYVHIIFLYLFLYPAYELFVTKHRAFYKYKLFAAMTVLSIGISLAASIVLVSSLPDRLEGRILGQYVPMAVCGLILYITNAVKGKRIHFKYWKYALVICIPLVPNVLSVHILGSSDRIIITKLCGSEATAIYSIAYSCANIVSVLINSMNKAWAPWFLDSLHHGDHQSIKKIMKPYFYVYVFFSFMVLLFCPEIITILGGNRYYEAIWVLPPLILGMLFQFIYTMFVQAEFYEKKTISVSIGTMIAAVLNVVLNFIFIPIFGYSAAAYTTLVGYFVLFLYHYRCIVRLGYSKLFCIKTFWAGVLFTFVIMILMLFLYQFLIIRYITILGVFTVGLIFTVRNRKKILGYIRKLR